MVRAEHYDVASLDSGRVRLRDPRPAEAGEGTIRLDIDGAVTVFHVVLSEGIDPERRYQTYQRVGIVQEATA